MPLVAAGPLRGEGKVRQRGQELLAQSIPFGMGTHVVTRHAQLHHRLLEVAIVLLNIKLIKKKINHYKNWTHRKLQE